MASILEVIIKSIFQNQGTQQAQSSFEKLGGAVNGINRVLGLVGLGVTTAQAAQFVNTSQELARAQNDVRNALTQLVGSTDAYTDAIQQVREATRGTLSETEAAQTAFGLLDNGIAKSAEEAAQYALAGKALNAALGQTASYEKFLMLLDEGSPMLMNNFNITQSMVDAQQRLVEANTTLTGSQARLQAIREVALQKGLALAGSLSKETILAQQAAAAQADFGASFGQLVISIDASFGVTEKAVTMFQTLTDGAKAWGYVLNEAIPAIQQHSSAMAESAAQTVLTSQSYDELAAATDAAEQDITAFQSALISGASSHEEYQAGVDRVAQSNIFLAGQLDLTAEQFDQQKVKITELAEATEQAAAATQAESAAVSVGLGPMEAAIAQTERRTRALRAKNEAHAESLRLEAADEAYAANLSAMGAAEREGYLASFRDKAAANAEAEREAAASSQRQVSAITQSFDQLGTQISGAVSGAIGELAQVWNPGGETDAANGAAQWARRMAAIAAGGLQDEWANPERWAGFGGDRSILQPLFNAISSGDDAAVRAQAQQLLATKTADLFDANMIAQKVEQQIREQRLKETLDAKVAQILGEKGLPAVTTATQQVTQATTATGAAANQVTTDLGTLTQTATGAGEQIGNSFTPAISQVEILNTRIRDLNSLLRETISTARGAAGAIAGLNPPAAGTNANGTPGDANRRMNGQTPL